MSEKITNGTLQIDTQYGYETRKYVTVEKTTRGKTTVAYFITEARELFGDTDLEESITNMRALAEGLTSPQLSLSRDYFPYEETPTYSMVITGERPATDEEISLIEKHEADIVARREAHDRAQRERLIEQLREDGYEVQPKV